MAWLAIIVAGAGVACAALSAWTVHVFACRNSHSASLQPPVTVLKPLSGDEPLLYENLRSFCAQDYPDFQIVFGVQSPTDAALPIVARLRSEFPALPLDVVVGSDVPGANPKVANLITMRSNARHDVLIIADSDIRVGPTYLSQVVAPFEDDRVGTVTCPYIARAAIPDFVNRLACLHINDGFLPQVLMARMLGTRNFCLGATIALRTATLTRIGGFEGLLNWVAEDYEVGARVARIGLTVELSDGLIETTTAENGVGALFVHELRWARTLRAIRPLGYAFTWLTLPVMVGFFTGALLLPSPLAPAIIFTGLTVRVLLNLQRARAFGVRPEPWLAIARDFLSFAVWLASYLGHDVVWRGQRMRLARAGELRR